MAGLLVLFGVLATLAVVSFTGGSKSPLGSYSSASAASAASADLVVAPMVRRALIIDPHTPQGVIDALIAHPHRTRISCRRAVEVLHCDSAVPLLHGGSFRRLWLVTRDAEGLFTVVRPDPLDPAVAAREAAAAAKAPTPAALASPAGAGAPRSGP